MGPVAVIEVKYQYKKTLQEVFHTTTFAGVIMPNLRVIMDNTFGSHKNAGLVIPAIYVDEPIVFNIDPNNESSYKEALKHGIAHASGTALPDTPGIGYYFAHSSAAEFVRQYNAVFYLLGKLKAGDEIYIWRNNQSVTYKVTESKITDPTDVSFLKDTNSAQRIVLQTCWPPGTSQRRMLVFAEKVETN